MNCNLLLKSKLEDLLAGERKAKMLYTVCLEHVQDDYLRTRMNAILQDEINHERLVQKLIDAFQK